MNIQDKSMVRTPIELEKKYPFEKLLGIIPNIETNKVELINVKNEITNMLNSLIINLRDVLDSQSDISLWFYEGVPTTSNLPYTSWDLPSEHDGDIYYNQETGYVYQYTYNQNIWVRNEDENLIQAMAITNSDIDTSDHERKVFVIQPTPPYESGDWWILNDGTLKICQLGKTTGEYDEQDFVIGNKYTPTIATQDGDIITIKQGQIIKMSDTFATFTDLATGGNTIINGANISTGTINTNNVSIGNNNVRIDADGVKLNNGAKVIGNNGLKNTYLYNTEGFIGLEQDYDTYENIARNLFIELSIPEGLEVTSAKIHVFHNPVFWGIFGDPNTYPGRIKNLKIYKSTNINSRLISAFYGSEYFADDSSTYSNIPITWYGTDGTSKGSSFTPSEPTISSYNMEEAITSDFSDIFKNNNVTIPGIYQIKLSTSENISQSWSESDLCRRTGFMYATLELEGYMTYS